METGLMKMYRGGLVSGSVSEFSDLEDDDEDDRFTVDDMDDDDTFELPLKATHTRSNNFAALTDNCGSLMNYSIDKKVRFEPGDGNNENVPEHNDATHYVSRSRSDSLKGKRNVEELLHYTNQVNEYMAKNLEKIDMFRSELLEGDLPPKSLSNETNVATTPTGSFSNFELSEDELEDTRSAGLANSELCSNLSDVSLSRASATSPEMHLELDGSVEKVEDHEGGELPLTQSKDAGVPTLEEIIEHISAVKSGEKLTKDIDVSHKKGSLILGRNGLAQALSGEMCPEDAIKVFQETIECILHMSQCHNCGGVDDDDSLDDSLDYSQFVMKSPPTLSFQDFICRIHSKCMFSPMVYLASSFLFQVLCLTRSEPEGSPCLKHRLQESEIHRLVIACVRVATKITEDHVHSHIYFSKVCGISKRLLSRLEMSLVRCLKNDSFMITAEKLAASPQIRDELRASKGHHS